MQLTQEQFNHIPFKDGPTSAKIVFIGEAPGKDEEADPKLRAFIGAAGKLQRGLLTKIGIPLSECYFTNILKERPPYNDYHAFIKANPTKFSGYKELLAKELEYLRPNSNLIVPLGSGPLAVITGKRGIESWRGSILRSTFAPFEGQKVIPQIHPSAILQNWLYRPATILDLKRIKEEYLSPEINLPKREYLIRPDFDTAIAFLEIIKRSQAKISVDIETLPNPCRIVSIQLCINATTALCIPFQYRDGRSYWPPDQEMIIWRLLVEILEAPPVDGNKRIIGQNFDVYDVFVLALHGFDPYKILEGMYMDTMEAFQCLQPQLPKGLDFLTSIYTREPFYKSEGKEWGTKIGEEEFWMYGCKDVLVVYEIFPQLEKELRDEGLWDFYQKRYMEMAKHRMRMSLMGLKRDEKARAQLAKQFAHDTIKMQCKLVMLVGESINVKSTPQMRKLLYETMKLPKQYMGRGDKKHITANEDALLKLSSIAPSEIFQLILGIRSKRTLYSTNIEGGTDSDGNIRCSFGYTETGRFTSYGAPSGTGCLLPEAEVLTPNGWCRLDTLALDDLVAVWTSKTRRIHFESPLAISSFDFNDNMIRATSWNHNNVYTQMHKVFVTSRNGGIQRDMSAYQLSNCNEQLIPLAGYSVGIPAHAIDTYFEGSNEILADCNLVRVLVMIQADGSIEYGSVRLDCTKKHKIDRCHFLLNTANIKYTLQKARKGYVRFYISAADSARFIALLGKDKLYAKWLLYSTSSVLQEIIDETKYWDAHIRGDSFIYFSKYRSNAEWIQTIAHLCGYSATIYTKVNNKYPNAYGYNSSAVQYISNTAVKPKLDTISYSKHYTLQPYKGKVWCITTSTGYFLVRYADTICVTGNSNLQNWNKEMRVMIVPD